MQYLNTFILSEWLFNKKINANDAATTVDKELEGKEVSSRFGTKSVLSEHKHERRGKLHVKEDVVYFPVQK